MTITSTNRKGKIAWEIPSLKTYLTSIMIRKNDISEKGYVLLAWMEFISIQSYVVVAFSGMQAKQIVF
jgi:hypothetical protein